jgi:hypothetical protein
MLEDGGLKTEDCELRTEDGGRGNLFMVYVYQQADCRARALLAITDLFYFVVLKVWRDCINVFVIWLIICKHP